MCNQNLNVGQMVFCIDDALALLSVGKVEEARVELEKAVIHACQFDKELIDSIGLDNVRQESLNEYAAA